MDHGTFFFTNIASVTVFTVSITLLAYYNPRIVGMRWFAGGMITGLAKLILQALEIKLPPEASAMIANELYLVSFMMQLMGLRWFVVRKPMRSRWPWILTGFLLTAYTVMFLTKIPYSGNVINIPFVVVCGASAWILLRNASGPFVAVSRVSAFILLAEMVVAAYRATLTNLHYMRPWETVHAQTDPRWMYSLAVMAFFASFMVMCDLWFLVMELQRELAELASTDPLTGALNRRAMEEAAQRETARSIRHDHPLCMIVIDIDNFKCLNDTRGHAAGDRALQALVCRTKATLRTQDLLARTGGEEFAILLPDTLLSDGFTAAERIRMAIEGLEIPFETGPIRLTISAGVAQFDFNSDGWESLMKCADAAMYDAKGHGRNSVAIGMSETIASEHGMTARLVFP